MQVQELTCRACLQQWKREVKRGRVPMFCPNCTSAPKILQEGETPYASTMPIEQARDTEEVVTDLIRKMDTLTHSKTRAIIRLTNDEMNYLRTLLQNRTDPHATSIKQQLS